jgi:magnesium chelatase subunit I
MSSAHYADRIATLPGFKKQLLHAAQTLAPDLIESPARDALVASVVEFILEGLHVHNKLNKSEKAGKAIYRH